MVRKSNDPAQLTENERLKIIIETLGYNQRRFAKLLGMEAGSLSGVLNGHLSTKKVGISNMLKRLLEVQFNVNLEWLQTGQGEMFASDAGEVKEETVEYRGQVAFLKGEIDKWRDKYFELNEKYIKLLEAQVGDNAPGNKNRTA